MKYQVGDLILYFQIPQAKRHFCLVTNVADGFVYVEWLSEHAQKTYTKALPPSALRDDRNGYWRRLS